MYKMHSEKKGTLFNGKCFEVENPAYDEKYPAVLMCFSFFAGVDALLCYSVKQSSSGNIPKEQLINVEKLRPGSGMLLVKVLADGPTRAVRICDVRQQVRHSLYARSKVTTGFRLLKTGFNYLVEATLFLVINNIE